MRPPLRDLFLDPAAFQPLANPLIRLGAVYHLKQTLETDELIPRLANLLEEAGKCDDGAQESFRYQLHLAVQLTEAGSRRGVDWLVERTHTEAEIRRRLVFSALRNCRQFPLAVLAAACIDSGDLRRAYEEIPELFEFTDDAAWEVSKNRAAHAAALNELGGLLQRLNGFARADRALGLGYSISRPLLRAAGGHRFSGFAAMEQPDGASWIGAYRRDCLLNPDDGAGDDNGYDLLRRPGSLFIACYPRSAECEIQSAYVLPFGALEPREFERRLLRDASRNEGAEIFVVACREKARFSAGKGRDRTPIDRDQNRLISARGNTFLSRFRVDDNRPGTLSIRYQDEGTPFDTRHRIAGGALSQVSQAFAAHTHLPRAVILLQPGETVATADEYRVLIENGQAEFRTKKYSGAPPDTTVVHVESYKVRDGSERQRPFALPLRWTEEDRREVVRAFLANTVMARAVVHSNARQPGEYRLLTSDGYSLRGDSKSSADVAENSAFVVDSFTRAGGQTVRVPFAIPYSWTGEECAAIVSDFVNNTRMPLGTMVKSWPKGFTIALRDRTVAGFGPIPSEPAFFVDVFDAQDRGRPVELPNRFAQSVRAHIFQDLFSSHPANFAVVLGYVKDIACLYCPANREVIPGARSARPAAATVVWLERVIEDGAETVFSSVLDDLYNAVGCGCHGSGVVLCAECGGAAEVTCGECHGTRKTTCDKCGGSQSLTCNGCNGHGSFTCPACKGRGSFKGGRETCNACGGATTVRCKKCSGSGSVDCRKCDENGEIWCACKRGVVTCPSCEGSRIQACTCGRQGQILIASRG